MRTKTIDELEPIPQEDPTSITDIEDEVEALDRAAEESTEPLRESNGFTLAPRLSALLRDVVYEDFPQLQNERFICVHSVKIRKSGGKPVLYEMRLMNGLHSFLSTYSSLNEGDTVDSAERFFLLIVPIKIWAEIDPKTQRCLVYEALCRCGINQDKGTIFLKRPDFDGFYNSIAKHGLWRQDLQQLGDVAKPHIAQLPLLEVAS